MAGILSGQVHGDLQSLTGTGSAPRRIIVRSTPYPRPIQQPYETYDASARASHPRLDEEVEPSGGQDSDSGDEIQAAYLIAST